MRNSQVTILSAPDTASQTSIAYDAGQMIAASFVAAFGDVTAVGTLQIQGSNDNPAISGYRQGAADGSVHFVPTNWANIPNATSVVAAGVAPAILIPAMCFSYIRAVYTHSSGGSSTILINMNQLSL